MAKTALSINLLDNKGEPFLDKLLRWMLSIGRAIVILTEVIALSAFIYRFSIDRRIVDLNDEIKDKQLILSQLDRPEREYRNLQERLTTAKRIEQTGAETTQRFNDVVTIGTGRIRFNTLSVSRTEIKIDGETPSTAQLNYFIQQLRQLPFIDRVSIDKLDNRTSQGSISVAITAQLNTPEAKAAKQAAERIQIAL
jgi:Tfp pilus assembly protein PilN